MNAVTEQFQFDISGMPDVPGATPKEITLKEWGYVVDGQSAGQTGNPKLRSFLARGLGAFLFVCAIALWAVPTTGNEQAMVTLRLGVMVMFMVIGVAMIWGGRQKPGLEMQVDQHLGEVRLGNRDIQGNFKPLDVLRFPEITSVYMMRPEQPGQMARLYLRISGGDVAVEIARGKRNDMERLRQRLMMDLTYRT